LVENVKRAMQIDAPKDEDGNPMPSSRGLVKIGRTLGVVVQRVLATAPA
jgi:hypothetical protein